MATGGKCHFADREDTLGTVSIHGWVFTGHSIPRWQKGERGAGKEKVLGLENQGGIPHGYQPLRSIPPTAEPVLIHSGDDTQHFPPLEAQLVRSCSSVVTESPDCPVRSQREMLGWSEVGVLVASLTSPPPRDVCPCWFSSVNISWAHGDHVSSTCWVVRGPSPLLSSRPTL